MSSAREFAERIISVISKQPYPLRDVITIVEQRDAERDKELRAPGPINEGVCPNDPTHKLSWRGMHCEVCGIFIGTTDPTRTALQTEQTMHAAWRKRAEEAEDELARYKAACEAGMALTKEWEDDALEASEQGYSQERIAMSRHCVTELRTALKAATEGE